MRTQQKMRPLRAAKAGFDLVIAAGGDGTINEVVSGIAPLKKRPQMAVIPTGTTNDFARALKIPRGNPVEAAKVIAKIKPFRWISVVPMMTNTSSILRLRVPLRN